MTYKLIAASIMALIAISTAAGQPKHLDDREKRAPMGRETRGCHDCTVDTILAGIDDRVREQFRRAWTKSGGGAGASEGVVLLSWRAKDGSLMAECLGYTNQFLSFTFKWKSTIIGVVHTHPNRSPAKPEGRDLQLADRFHVPVFTITSRGMFVYDPATRRVSQVASGLNWLNSTATDESTVLANH